MITIHISADISLDRQVLLRLPPETPTGKADLVVTIAPQAEGSSSRGKLRAQFGAVRSGDPRSADNERIDADLARAYGNETD